MDENCNSAREIRSRIEQARTTVILMKKFIVTTEISLELIECYMLPVLLHGCEAWTLNKAMEAKIDA